MTVIVEVPGHGEVEFPDGMSDAEMEAAIRKNFMMPPKSQSGVKMEQSPSYLDRMKKVGSAGAEGLMQGGPAKAFSSAAGEAMNQQNQVCSPSG